MSKIELTAVCNFGVEKLLGREIHDLGYDTTRVIDGRIDYMADEEGIVLSNLWLRTAERVLIKMAEFEAVTFEELFQGVKAIDWAAWLPKDCKFPVAKASSIKSTLFSTRDIQAISKKAVVSRMSESYGINWFSEEGALYPINIFINKDLVTVYIDTSGMSLHKRGYRQNTNIAPIRETLACAMVSLTPWREDRLLVDPMCGSGTIPIEAAMKALNIAPGINREFLCEEWGNIPNKVWQRCRQEALEMEKRDYKFKIQAYDIDGRIVHYARENAKLAGVEDYIHFQERPLKDLSSNDKYGFIITNPPYGERLEEKDDVIKLYREMGEVFQKLDSWSYNIITAYEGFEQLFGKRSDKKRKLYNGMMKTYLYQYFGPKPPRRAENQKKDKE